MTGLDPLLSGLISIPEKYAKPSPPLLMGGGFGTWGKVFSDTSDPPPLIPKYFHMPPAREGVRRAGSGKDGSLLTGHFGNLESTFSGHL